jgi:hypothetical protein
MLPAQLPGMRRFLPVMLVCLAACGGGSLTIEGTLADSTQATEVWALGRPERIPVVNGAFRLEKVEGDTVELRFTAGDEGEARMVLHALPDGGTVRLDGIWFDEEVAFPARVAGRAPVFVNGLRMAGPEAVPENVNLPGSVLAVSEDGDALVVRPDDASLPDLKVLVTPASVVRTIDGDLVEPDRLGFGDSLRVSGIGQGGHVIAAEIMVSRRAAARDEDEASRSTAPDDDAEVAQAPRPEAVQPVTLVREPPTARAEPGGKGYGKGNGGGNGRGKGKGRN